MRIWELIGKFFQKLSWCSTTAGYPYLEISAAGKNYPWPRLSQNFKSPGLIGLKLDDLNGTDE